MGSIVLGGYPICAAALITASTRSSLVVLSNNKNSTATPLMIRPAHSRFFEMGAA
jgi:hypothetical protein